MTYTWYFCKYQKIWATLISSRKLVSEVAQSPSRIYLCQQKCALDIISKVSLLGARHVAFPLDQNYRLALATGYDFPDPKHYQWLVGWLIYLAVTMPDISYVIHVLMQFMQKPKTAHWKAALRVVCFLKNNLGQGILLRAKKILVLAAWCNSDLGWVSSYSTFSHQLFY